MPTTSDFDIESIIESVLAVIGGLGFVVPIAIFALANLVGRVTQSRQADDRPAPRGSHGPAQPSPSPRRSPWTTMQPMPSFPNGPVSRTGPAPTAPVPPAPRASQSSWGSTFDANDAAREDRALTWGSAFDANDADKRDHGLQWGSAFDHEREATKWGWDEQEWGAGFREHETEPRITVG